MRTSFDFHTPTAACGLYQPRDTRYVDRGRMQDGRLPRGTGAAQRRTSLFHPAARQTTAHDGFTVHQGLVQEHSTATNDLDLVAGMARGDERAASALYDRHSAVMYGLALRMVGETADAEEVVLDAFSQAWRDAARYDATRGAVGAWLVTIVRTRALDLIRARGRRARVADSAAAQVDAPVGMGEGFAAPDHAVGDAERATAVTSALGVLPEAQRRAIELAYFEGLTHQEIAERLAEPLGTVKTRIRLAMGKLRDALRNLAPEVGT